MRVTPLMMTPTLKSLPKNFEPVKNLLWAKPARYVPRLLTTEKKYTGARGRGIKYEKQVHEHLQKEHGDWYVPGPWYVYAQRNENRVRYAQPDGLLFRPDLGKVTVIEIKLKHVPRSWWQLRHKYEPLIKHCFPWMQVAVVEFVQWYDLTTPFPEAVDLRPDLRSARVDGFQVTIWKPGR